VKRVFDIVVSLVALVLLSPFMLLIALFVGLGSSGGMFFRQVRVGKDGREFRLLKFRTMRPGSESAGQITIGERDPRITGVGHFLRRTKLDELPQLLNILVGDMSIVGPRPEVPRYVALYTAEQRRVLSVRPGLSSLASIAYIKENEVLGRSTDPERTYVEEVMPAKLELDLEYVECMGPLLDLRIIARTVARLVLG
jgi:lipopolysaccharide/colanic/teichoic acid biosynthesis glycosyltransferase